jgi:ADP-glucose pyrophosphorylase
MKAIGIILAGGNNNRMKELTAKRAVPALPVAGSFRSYRFFTQQHVKLTYTDSCDIDTI